MWWTTRGIDGMMRCPTTVSHRPTALSDVAEVAHMDNVLNRHSRVWMPSWPINWSTRITLTNMISCVWCKLVMRVGWALSPPSVPLLLFCCLYRSSSVWCGGRPLFFYGGRPLFFSMVGWTNDIVMMLTLTILVGINIIFCQNLLIGIFTKFPT